MKKSRTPNNQQAPSGSKYWSTANELHYLEHIGTFGKVFISTKQMLRNYIKHATIMRANWGEMNKQKVLAFALRRLKNEGRIQKQL